MKCFIAGLGSMGKRRLRLVRRFFPEMVIAVLDARQDRRDDVSRSYGCTVYESFEGGLAHFSPDVLIVSTPPDTHAPSILSALGKGIHTFSELDLLDDGYDKVLPFEEKGFPVAFLSSTPSTAPKTVDYRKPQEDGCEKVHIRTMSGSTFRTGTPGKSTTSFRRFATDERHPGNSLHRAAWLTECFGKVTDFSCSWSRTSSLNLPYPDTCQVLLRHGDGTSGSFTLDCVSRRRSESADLR